MDREGKDFSGVYMASPAKKIPSSEVPSSNAPNAIVQEDVNLVKDDPTNQVPPNQQHKKKVRRRLHTSRPFQERLLNMAEARKEIITALKFHRASMKQQRAEQLPLQDLSMDARADVSSRNSPMIYPSDGCLIFPNPIDSLCQLHDPSFIFALPSQTLGLNLNFQDFSNLSTSRFQNDPSLFASPSSSTSFAGLSSTTAEDIHSVLDDSHHMAGSGLMSPCPEMDSREMKSIRSLGECHEMVGNDPLNLATSPEEFETPNEGALFRELTEIPFWLNSKDISITCPEDSSPDPALPW